MKMRHSCSWFSSLAIYWKKSRSFFVSRLVFPIVFVDESDHFRQRLRIGFDLFWPTSAINMRIASGVVWSMGVLTICLVSARDQRKKITTSVALLRLPRVTVLLLGCRLLCDIHHHLLIFI